MRFSQYLSATLLIFYSALSTSLFGQNLVPNWSLEETAFENNNTPLGKCKYWFQPGLGTSDYFQTSTPGPIGSPSNFVGHQQAHGGNSYAGIAAFGIFFPEFLSIKLAEPMVAGGSYHVSFYVSLADSSRFAIDKLGAHFSVDSLIDYSTVNPTRHFNVMPQVESPSGQIIADTSNWTLIQDWFIAQGGERFMTIGTFIGGHDLDSALIPGNQNVVLNGAYYYIDDVCVVSDLNFGCDSALPIGIDENQFAAQFSVYPNPTQGSLKLGFPKADQVQVSLLDLTGRTLYATAFWNTSPSSPEEIDLAGFATGVYLLQIDYNGQLFTRKVIVE